MSYFQVIITHYNHWCWWPDNVFWASNKQTICWNWFFDFWRLCFRSHILEGWYDEDVMIHYNNDHNAYCWAVNGQNFKTMQHNTVWISTLLCTRNPYSYSHFEIFICIYSVIGEIDQISTNTCAYTTCCAANIHLFVYMLIGTPGTVCLLIDSPQLDATCSF